MSIYAANSRLQLIVEAMEPLGQGALALAFEQLKLRLKQEGLFEPLRKKVIKPFNQTVGIVTSSHGAVLRDMVRILKSRMPGVNIVFCSVRVQGTGAAGEIANALRLLDACGGCDVIILGRGGGSLEDLWPFNEELTARAIFSLKTPIISAVGHETDFTISDFVADVRAATPTHAATMVVPQIQDLISTLNAASVDFHRVLMAKLRQRSLNLYAEKRRLKDPRVLLFRHWQRIDEYTKVIHDFIQLAHKTAQRTLVALHGRLAQRAPFRLVRIKRESLFKASSRLLALHPRMRVSEAGQRLVANRQTLLSVMASSMSTRRQGLHEAALKLDAMSPLKVLARGFSVVHDEASKKILMRTADFRVHQRVVIQVEDGTVQALICE